MVFVASTLVDMCAKFDKMRGGGGVGGGRGF